MALPPIRQKLLSPLNNEFQKLLRRDVATRYMGTAAAARVIPRTRKRVSKLERRAMVEEYVVKYREMNAGKFPTAKNAKEHVGGGYYKVRAILQELEYNSKLPAVPTAANNSTIQQAAQVNWNPDARLRQVTPDSQGSDKDNRTAAVDERGTSAECYLCDEIDKNSGFNMVDKSTLNQNHETTANYVSGCERVVDLELGEERARASADIGKSDIERILESRIMPCISSVVKRTLAKETLMAMTMDESESPPKLGHPSQVYSTCGNPKPEVVDEDSGQAFESDEHTRCKETHVRECSSVIGSKKQVSNPDSAIIEELDTSMVGDGENDCFEVEKTLDCQARVGKTVRSVAADDCQVSTAIDSSSQKEVDSFQKMIGASILIKTEEVTAEDVCRHEETATMNEKATATEDCDYFVKPSHPSELPQLVQNTEIDEIDEASTEASKYDEILRGTTAQEPNGVKEMQKSSLWGSLKFFASNFISRW